MKKLSQIAFTFILASIFATGVMAGNKDDDTSDEGEPSRGPVVSPDVPDECSTNFNDYTPYIEDGNEVYIGTAATNTVIQYRGEQEDVYLRGLSDGTSIQVVSRDKNEYIYLADALTVKVHRNFLPNEFGIIMYDADGEPSPGLQQFFTDPPSVTQSWEFITSTDEYMGVPVAFNLRTIRFFLSQASYNAALCAD